MSSDKSLVLHLAAVPESVTVARAAISDLLVQAGVAASVVGDIRLAVTEACANVVVHAYVGLEAGPLRVAAELRTDLLEITVRDFGRGLVPHPEAGGLGLGIPLIASVARSCSATDSAAGTEIRMTFQIRQSADGARPARGRC